RSGRVFQANRARGSAAMKIVLTAMLLLSLSLAGAQQQPMFSSRTNAVQVDVLASKGGKLLRGLTAADFEIRDNGVLQQPTLVGADELPLNVVLALDLSDSITGSRLRDLQNAGVALLNALTERDGAGLVTFGFAVTAAEQLTRDRNA